MSNFYLIYNKTSALHNSIDFLTFSDGFEICRVTNLPVGLNKDAVKVVANLSNGNSDIIRLGLIKDALDNLGFESVSLVLPYIPNARADRRFGEGESFALKVTCGIINSFRFSKVYVTDPHSDVAGALLDNIEIQTQLCTFNNNKFLISEKEFTLVAPDIGAAKKTFDLAKMLGHTDYVQGLKIRDISTGNIVKCDVQYDGSLEGKTVVMVDDIADGGASFIYLGKKLKDRGASKVILYVTHGIFSKGLEPLVGAVDQIICPYLMEKYINTRDIEIFNTH